MNTELLSDLQSQWRISHKLNAMNKRSLKVQNSKSHKAHNARDPCKFSLSAHLFLSLKGRDAYISL